MQFLDDAACAAWCFDRNYPVRQSTYGHHVLALDDNLSFKEFVFPVDSGRKVGLARAVINWYMASGSCLIWIVEFGIWPSSEHRPLYDRLREALGGQGGLAAGSGHLVDLNDKDDAISIVALALFFFWDVYVLPDNAGSAFFSSHDEYAGLYLAPSESAVPQVLEEWLESEQKQV